MNADQSWYIDKKIPLALVIAIVGQTFVFGWMASALRHDVDTIRHDIDTTLNRVDKIEAKTAADAIAALPQVERLVRVEVKVDAMHDDVISIKRALSLNGQPH